MYLKIVSLVLSLNLLSSFFNIPEAVLSAIYNFYFTAFIISKETVVATEITAVNMERLRVND
jgi:hypothetical protein